MRFVLYVLGLAASNLGCLVVTAVFGDPSSYPPVVLAGHGCGMGGHCQRGWLVGAPTEP